ncbi:MAG TPA: hypothetical protein VFC84_07270 [Desulfosporosinus sp.]|nr:hypothetical protein [Desulfosporosinus sp.]
MSVISRIFMAPTTKPLVDLNCPTDFRQLLRHDEYDTYLFNCAKQQIESLQKAINLKDNDSCQFETLLRDVFAMCYKAEPEWEDNAEGGINYNILNNMMKETQWPELRKHTRFNGLLSASATVAFAQEYKKREEEQEKQLNELKEKSSRAPRFLGIFKKKVTAETVESRGEDITIVEIEHHVASQKDQLTLWGITPPMLPQEPERVMALAGLLERHQEFLQFAEKVGQLRESLVSLGKKKLRNKGVRLRGVSVGHNIVQAVPAELALLGDVASEAIFYDRALGGKLTLYDYAAKSEQIRGSMVIVIDASGSVRGEKGYLIRGLAVALVQLARIEKRWASVIIFGSKNEQKEFVFNPNENAIADRLVEMATTFYGGDTIFWEPLELAFERLSTKPFRQGDLVLVTDYIQGSEGPLSKFTKRFAQAKSKLGFRYFSLFLPSAQWVNDLSWHTLADQTISLDKNFFNKDSSAVINKFVSSL